MLGRREIWFGPFDGAPEGEQPALDFLGLGELLPFVLSDFENEFSAIKPYFQDPRGRPS